MGKIRGGGDARRTPRVFFADDPAFLNSHANRSAIRNDGIETRREANALSFLSLYVAETSAGTPREARRRKVRRNMSFQLTA